MDTHGGNVPLSVDRVISFVGRSEKFANGRSLDNGHDSAGLLAGAVPVFLIKYLIVNAKPALLFHKPHDNEESRVWQAGDS